MTVRWWRVAAAAVAIAMAAACRQGQTEGDAIADFTFLEDVHRVAVRVQ
jgi:hypothetical protein